MQRLLRAALGLAALALLPGAQAQTQDLYAVTNGRSSVTRFDGSGTGQINTSGTPLYDPSLTAPSDLAFDTHGDLFVANRNGQTVNDNGSITEFAAGPAPGTFGAVTTLTGPLLRNPGLLTVDTHGNLFTLDGLGLTELPAGPTPGTFGPATLLADKSLNGAFSLTSDAHGDLFGTNPNANTITILPAGAAPGVFGPATTLTDPSLNTPTGVALDAHGNLFVANDFGDLPYNNGSITEFLVGPTPGIFGQAVTLADPNLSLIHPLSLAFDAQGDLFAANEIGGLSEFAFDPATGTLGAGQMLDTRPSDPQHLAFGPFTPAAVPEASSVVSLGFLLALGGLFLVRRKRTAA